MKKILIFISASIFSLVSLAQNAIEVTFDSFKDEPVFVEGWDTWTINMQNDAYRFSFDIVGTADSYVGTFSTSDGTVDGGFSFGYILSSTTRINFATCDLTIVETHPSKTITRYVLEANILSTDGVKYLVKASYDVLTPTETLEGIILNAQVNPTDAGFVVLAKSDSLNLDINLAFNWVFGIDGNFTAKQIDTLKTAITHDGKTFVPVELDMYIEYTDSLTNGDMGYTIPVLQFVSPDVVSYSLKLEAPIVFADTVDIVCTNLSWDASLATTDSIILFQASNATYSIEGMYTETLLRNGVYEGTSLSVEIKDIATGKTIYPRKNTMTISGNILLGYSAKLTVLGDDHVCYLLNLSYVKEPVTATEEVKVENSLQKQIQNGTLVILKDGVKYNVLGSVIK